MTTTPHSPEAIAAYPDGVLDGEGKVDWVTLRQREAYDRGARESAEKAWDECVKSIVYDTGQPVEIVAVVNPFRSVPKEQQ